MQDNEPLLRDISDTALWAAVFRAREAEREDALFRDTLAKRLAGSRGPQILDDVPHAAENSWSWIMRTYLFDRIISEQLLRGADMVLNLGAGLDARPYRMALSPSLEWVEADLPQIISYKEQVLAGEQPRCRMERVAIDLSDTAKRRQLLARLSVRATRIMVLTEGLLIYLADEEVATLARDLAGSVDSWVLDMGSPALLKMMQRTTGEAADAAGAPYQFGPPAGPDFFLPYGWGAAEVRSLFQAAIETARVPPELASFKDIPEPPRPWESAVWAGVCRLQRTA